MEQLKKWLIPFCIIFFLLILFFVIILYLKRKNKIKKLKQEKSEKIITLQPLENKKDSSAELIQKNIEFPYEISNVQGIGNRDNQQDSFAISPLDKEIISKKGLISVICDGMGGLCDGYEISQFIVSEIMNHFLTNEKEDYKNIITSINTKIKNMYNGKGGSTLIAVLLKEDIMNFWSIGDSDIFLFRKNRLYAVNKRHEYENDLILNFIRGNIPINNIFTNPQAGALSSYIGAENIKIDTFSKQFRMKDGDKILLCTDGVSDIINCDLLTKFLNYSPQICCGMIENYILENMDSNQDNYTAVVIQYIQTERQILYEK